MSTDGRARRVAVVGAGWAGLAAAVRGVQAGHAVTLIEMAAQAGGRARSLDSGKGNGGGLFDNGQHILIGAYSHTLQLMRSVGADVDALFLRRPLELRYPDGRGLRLPRGPAWLVFGLGVTGAQGWSWPEKAALLKAAAGWAAQGFRCPPSLTVAALCEGLPPALRELLIDPLCVAALNTPAAHASAEVLLRVLRDALFGGRGAADLLLPRRPLSDLLPNPALAWLATAGAGVRLAHRVQRLAHADAGGFSVDGEAFDAVVLACTPGEAARLCRSIAPAWADIASGLAYEPIVTVYLHCEGARLPCAMTALRESADAPAQFAFDLGALGGPAGRFAFVVSGARRWVTIGLDATAAAVVRQATATFPPGTWPQRLTVLRSLAEKRATLRCTPGLVRPAAVIAPGLAAAGDYVAGPYPSTLEGAVRAGEAAIALVGDQPGPGSGTDWRREG